MHLRLASGNGRGVSYAMSFVLFTFLAVLGAVMLVLLVYFFVRRWL